MAEQAQWIGPGGSMGKPHRPGSSPSSMPIPKARLFPFSRRDRYYCKMLRSGSFRFLAVVLFIIGGLTQPVWELAHALTHLHGDGEAKAGIAPFDPRATSCLTVVGDDHGHQYPMLKPSVRPASQHVAAGSALPSSFVLSCIDRTPVRAIPLVVVPEARAGPDATFPSQSRAPPLL